MTQLLFTAQSDPSFGDAVGLLAEKPYSSVDDEQLRADVSVCLSHFY